MLDLGNLHCTSPSVIFLSSLAGTILALAHDIPPPLSHELAQPARTTGRYHACGPAIAGRTPSPWQVGDPFSYRWLAQHVEHAGSGFPHQVDVPDSDWAGARRRGDVESCFHDPAAVPVRCARGRRSVQATNGYSVVVGPWRTGMDREIQSGGGPSEARATRSLPSLGWISYPAYALGKRHLLAQRSSAEVMANPHHHEPPFK